MAARLCELLVLPISGKFSWGVGWGGGYWRGRGVKKRGERADNHWWQKQQQIHWQWHNPPTHTHMHTHILVAVASISLCSVLLFLTDLLQFDGFAFLVLCKNVLDPVDLWDARTFLTVQVFGIYFVSTRCWQHGQSAVAPFRWQPLWLHLGRPASPRLHPGSPDGSQRGSRRTHQSPAMLWDDRWNRHGEGRWRKPSWPLLVIQVLCCMLSLSTWSQSHKNCYFDAQVSISFS